MDDTPPLDFRLLEIDEKADGPAGGWQIVDSLRGVLAGQLFHTFQLDRQHVLDEQIGKLLSDRVTLVGDCKRSFGGSPEAAKTEFCKQRPSRAIRPPARARSANPTDLYRRSLAFIGG
jgi:hypothetical protein